MIGFQETHGLHRAFSSALLVALGRTTSRRCADALLARFNREKSPVWADGEVATFFFRGEADRVQVIAGGDFKALKPIGSSDVWAVSYKLPDLQSAVISYHLTATKKGSATRPAAREEGVWRGPKAPRGFAQATELRGSLKTLEIASTALGAPRKATVYLPPGSDRAKAIPVIYMADGESLGGYAQGSRAAHHRGEAAARCGRRRSQRRLSGRCP